MHHFTHAAAMIFLINGGASCRAFEIASGDSVC